MRESWTDDRLDHLSSRMDERFDRVDERFAQTDQRLDRLDTDFKEMRAEINARFDSLQHSLFIAAMGMLGAFGGALIGACYLT